MVVVLAAVAAVAAAPVSAWAWGAPVHERVALYAMKLMPPALAAQLSRHRDALLEGARAPDLEGAPERHTLLADGGGGTLDRDAAAAVERTRALLEAQGTFADVARELGRLSHFAADAAFPLNTSASDPRAARYYADFTAYATSKLDRYPPIFDGYVRLDQGFDAAAYVRGIAERANRSYPLVSAGYFPEGTTAMRNSSSFDDRGPVFGVTQLSFVHAVSATANLWLHVWREAHGDLAGTPHYSTGPKPAMRYDGVPDRTRAPQRP